MANKPLIAMTVSSTETRRAILKLVSVLAGPAYQQSDQNKPLAYQGTISKKIIIGSDIWIGARVTILSDVKINDRVVVGAGSLVNKNLESGYLYVGTPAVRKKKLYN